MQDAQKCAANQETPRSGATATPDLSTESDSKTINDILSVQYAYMLPSLSTYLQRFHARQTSSSSSSPSLPPSFHLLDIGCGSGKLTRALAAYIANAGFPDACVTGVDISAAILMSARIQAEAEGFGENVRFLQADVLGPGGDGDFRGGAKEVGGKGLLRGLLFRGIGKEGKSPPRRTGREGREGERGEGLPFEKSLFDVVHCHQVLAHVSRPVDAIGEMIRVVKKRRIGSPSSLPSSDTPSPSDSHPDKLPDPSTSGGLICLREGDLTTVRFTPSSPLLEEFFDIIRTVHKSQGGEPAAGKSLAEWVQKAVSREYRGEAGRRGREKNKQKKKKDNCKSKTTAAMTTTSMEACCTPTVTATRKLWCGGTTRADREAYGGHWPGRCRQGMFFEEAVAMGVER
jgi:ubiquinone/menaquinone biosynthesis C-methylase UbiE